MSSKLFVNLGASQARRRLKGFGYGVSKVETAGNDKAVIIHSAKGKHLRQLAKKFADVGYSDTENGLTKPMDLVDMGEPSAVSEEKLASQDHGATPCH